MRDGGAAAAGAVWLLVSMAAGNLAEERRTHSIIGAFFRSYNELGFGFLESICCDALQLELVARAHHVEREVKVPVWYRGERIGVQRVDMLVDRTVVIEVKSAAVLYRNPTRQLYNYL